MGLALGLSFGPQASADLAEAATNPVANLVQFRLQNQYSWENYNADSWSNAAIVQTVTPIPSLASKFDSLQGIVVRSTLPYVSTPQLNGVGRKHGMGDTNVLAFAVPKKAPPKTIWGVGPAIDVPTGGDDEFTGSGTWKMGPAAVFMVTPRKGTQIGALVFHQWDTYDIRSDAADFSSTFIQPIFFQHFPGGWYVGLPDTPQNYDWEEEEWTLNLGLQVGRVFPIGKQPMQVFGGVYYNSEEKDEGRVSAEWTFKFQVGWLLPQ
jgi:hypothetical protein